MAGWLRNPTNGASGPGPNTAVWDMVRAFTGSPSRPTGSAGASASISRLVYGLSWLYDLAALSEREGRSPKLDAETAEVREQTTNAASDLLSACAKILGGEDGRLPEAPLEKALMRLEESTSRQVLELAGSDSPQKPDDERSLGDTFRLAEIGRTTLGVARAVAVVRERERAMGIRTRLRTWLTVWGPEELAAAGRTIRNHSALRSTWFRNSVRGAAGITLAVLAAELLPIQNGFWVVLGTLAILRSDALGTRRSALRGMAGTVVGIVAAAGVLVAIGNDHTLLWSLFPVAVLVAVYARTALSFGVGQAGFAAMVIILYNLADPVGWQIGLVRIQDVAIGCGISLLVGFLIWPRGAVALIRDSVKASYRDGADLLAHRARSLLAGDRYAEDDELSARSAKSNARLDAALRQFLDEPGEHPLKNENMIALCAGGMRLAGTAAEIGLVRSAEWFDPSTPAAGNRPDRAVESVTGWYRSAGNSLGAGRRLPEPVAAPGGVLRALRDGSGEPSAILTRFWIREHLASLAELSGRYAQRSGALRDAGNRRSPDGPPDRPGSGPGASVDDDPAAVAIDSVARRWPSGAGSWRAILSELCEEEQKTQNCRSQPV